MVSNTYSQKMKMSTLVMEKVRAMVCKTKVFLKLCFKMVGFTLIQPGHGLRLIRLNFLQALNFCCA